MCTARGPIGPDTEFALEGFVTLSKWAAVAPAVERRLLDRPGEIVDLECGRVTGFAPGAFFALACLVESAPGRVRLRNWPATVSRAIVPLILVTRVLDDLVADLAGKARRMSESIRAELDESVTHLASRVAELKQNWLGHERLKEHWAPARTASN